MQVSATTKFARFSPQKGRLVADQIRGLSAAQALNVLNFSGKRAARVMKDVLVSAIANAENNEGADVDELVVSAVYVTDGPRLKRMSPRAKGRADRILRRMCHITLKVSDEEGKK
ncbi:MAG: 50S ribosomal protein L22 [Pseudomonadota bacterium]|nr:50S ribosomal protein L22 [Gammaproteobacteria bacterium]MBU1559144.1 50S ribosomal protein L22 [Gammaproteobacteria bacterium]MBU1926701.1 50S ribosomal protein L22 [Gammaproteobacteria bacterium]MBU2545975.1 50S ribosomal protein L22 [Gammaproteobacteria bacterium]